MSQRTGVNAIGFAGFDDREEDYKDAFERELRGLDVKVQPRVLDRGINAPPGSPASGAAYIVGTSPTGVWSGHANAIARWNEYGSEWEFWTPKSGWSVYVVDEAAMYRWDASVWTEEPVGKISALVAREHIHLGMFGALVGDGVTDESATIAAAEASAYPEIYLPDGRYRTTGVSLKKRYTGPGTIMRNQGGTSYGEPGRSWYEQHVNSTRLERLTSGISLGRREIEIISDSIGFGFGGSWEQSWPAILQRRINSRLPFGQGPSMSGSNMERCTPAGTVVNGTRGPLKTSKILSSGASISFVADDVDYIWFHYRRTSGAGTITVTASGANAWSTSGILVQSCAGADADDVASSVSGRMANGKGCTYTLTASGGAVEITGISVSHELGDAEGVAPFFVRVHAMSGHATSDFGAAQLASIKAQRTYTNYFPLTLICLGTNDAYNQGPGKGVLPSVYKANLAAMVDGLKASPGDSTAPIILTVPLRPGETTFTPFLAPFEKYREAVYELGRERGLPVADLSEIRMLLAGAYMDDKLHPNAYGQAMIANFWEEYLGVGNIPSVSDSAAIAVQNSAVDVGGEYSRLSATMSRGGLVTLSGIFETTGIAAGTVIGLMPPRFAPQRRKLMLSAGVSSPNGGYNVLQIEKTGQITLFDRSPGTANYASLEGISYRVGEL